MSEPFQHYDHVLHPTADLVPYARNARKHSPKQIDQIVASIREYGFTNPILIDENKAIIAGHGRVMAAKQMGMAELPCVIVAGLDEDQKRALVIADNKLAELATWDETLLREELKALADAGYNLDTIGFTDEELAEMLKATVGRTDPDTAPDVPLHPVSQPGDVWLLGRHRLVCGSSLDPDSVADALHGVEPNLMVTDPPYGVRYEPGWRKRIDGRARTDGKVDGDHNASWLAAYKLFPGNIIYLWHGMLQASMCDYELEEAGFAKRAEIIWRKPHYVISRGDFHAAHESAWYGVRQGERGMRQGLTGYGGDASMRSTVWDIDNGKLRKATGKDPDADRGVHGTQKPVECMRRPIELSSNPGHAIYDPFVGSGTSIIAAEMTGRNAHAVEINPAYIDVCVWRWMHFTGAEARHEETGMTIHDLAEQRQVEVPKPHVKVKE